MSKTAELENGIVICFGTVAETARELKPGEKPGKVTQVTSEPKGKEAEVPNELAEGQKIEITVETHIVVKGEDGKVYSEVAGGTSPKIKNVTINGKEYVLRDTEKTVQEAEKLIKAKKIKTSGRGEER